MAGGGSSKGSGGKKRARIEIIPLIDVIFFLLATFVLFTLALNKSGGLRVALPESQTGVARDLADTATVTIKEDGTYAWDKEPVVTGDLVDHLKTFHVEHPEPDAHILINGDTNATFFQVIYVFDEARKAGIQKVLIETVVKPKSSS
jgi:biopolymer transport protein ExbD